MQTKMQIIVLWCYYRDSGNFMIKNYYPIHKCLPSHKNKMCTTKFISSRLKDEITKQPFENMGNKRIMQGGVRTACG